MLMCEYCNKSLKRVGKGRKARFCSEVCRRKWWAENEEMSNKTKYNKICLICGLDFETISKIQKYCSRACSEKSRKTGRTKFKKICPYCNKKFTTIDKSQIYCSATCASRYYGEKRKRYKSCLYCGKQFHTDHFDRYNCCSRECSMNYRFGTPEERLQKKLEREQHKKQQPEISKICLWCKQSFSTKLTQKRCCSKECSYEYQKMLDRQEWAETFVPKEFYCIECGTKVVTEVGSPRSSFCSEKCSTRYFKKSENAKEQKKEYSKKYKVRREQQIREAFVAPVIFDEIFKRDNGICQICGLKVKDKRDTYHCWGATIDHVIPMSKGGTHEPDNCQLAHRICNSLKNDNVDWVNLNWHEMASRENYWQNKLTLYSEYMNE